MPRAFEITSPVKTVSLDGASTGEVTFAITNLLDHAAKVRVSIVPEGATKEAWLALAEPTKNVNVKQTETFTVRVAVPSGTTLGDYAFKIVAANDANPEEESTEGPSVGFHVGPTHKKPFPWWWIAIGAAAAVGLGVGLYFIFHHPTPPIGNPCKTDVDCAAEQKCGELSSGSRACLLRPGQKCENDISCSSFWCVETTKVCSKDDGSCETDADCRGDSYTCTPSKLCLRKIDQPCTENGECTTGNCASNVCKPAVVACPVCPKWSTCDKGVCRSIFIKDTIFRFTKEPVRLRVTPVHN
jgi:hypothetical protein